MKTIATSNSVDSNQKDTYVRARDNPFFDGMRRGEAAIAHKSRIFNFQEKMTSKNINRSASDIGDRGARNFSISATEDIMYSSKNSASDIVLEPVGRSLSGRWSKTSSPLGVFHPDLNTNLLEANESSTVFSPDISDANEEFNDQSGLSRPSMQRSYNVSKRQTDISNAPLPPSAALFYSGPSPLLEIVESSENVHKLNLYLIARRDDVNAGVPGRFLHAVIGPDIAGVGSVASTIMYAFYLDQMHKSKQFCTVPVINVKRAELYSYTDLQWLLDSCHIDQLSLICIDEIDLSYYDLFGGLKIVLLNFDKIPSELEVLKGALIEVFNCTKILHILGLILSL